MSNSETITRRLDYVTEITAGSSAKSSPADASERRRFTELAEKLVQVPKRELDEKREK